MQYRGEGSDNLLAQLKAVLKAAKTFEVGKDTTLDLTDFRWASPLQVLPLAILVNQNRARTFSYPKNADCDSYLQFIGFPKGKTSLSLGNNHIPILEFPTKADDPIISNDPNSQLFHLFAKYVGATPNSLGWIANAISEMVDNIQQHAKVNTAYILAQFYPGKKFLDICILDTGISIPGSYEAHNIEFKSDGEAVMKALSGVSTRKEGGRGKGLPTTMEAVSNLFGGEAVVMSRKGVAIVGSKMKIDILESSIGWQGTLLLLRIPVQKKSLPKLFDVLD